MWSCLFECMFNGFFYFAVLFSVSARVCPSREFDESILSSRTEQTTFPSLKQLQGSYHIRLDSGVIFEL